jgi:hypothetical protein
MTIGSAVISADGTYRYSLVRIWDPARPRLVFVMLNPSTADASEDDRTIGRCMDFARRNGYGSIEVVNLFALRSTDPRHLATHPDPVGPDNDLHLQRAAYRRVVVVAWGAHPMTKQRVAPVLRLLRNASRECTLHCLGMTKSLAPRHPLYVSGTQPLVPYDH